MFFNSSEADVCNYSMLIGQLLAACDVSSQSGISGEEGDIFWLCSKVTELEPEPCVFSASPVEARPAHVWWSIKITRLLLFNRHPGPLLQLAFSNELTEIGCGVLPFMSPLRESISNESVAKRAARDASL